MGRECHCFARACPLGAEGLRVEFDRQCSTERRHDPLTVMDSVSRIVSVRSGAQGGGQGGRVHLAAIHARGTWGKPPCGCRARGA